MSSSKALLSFSDLGAGVPVVFLHPTPLDREYWRLLASRLTGVRAILPDLRGHGQSGLGADLAAGGFAAVPDAPVLSMERLAADVLALLDHLHIQKAVFAGCSIGGYVLLELWRQTPERVLGLAFVCSKPQPDAAANAARRAATIAEARAGNRAKLYDGMVQSLTGATARATHPEILPALRRQMDAVTAEALVAVQAGLATRPDSVADVATIRVPVLAVAGGEDPGVTADEMRTFEQAPGGCSFHLLPTAGHFAAYEQPDAVAGLLRAWLRHFQG
jgi:pimeloyl-ACP methyl ester carboxylesterase